jgi:hypothetical protein
LILLPLQVVQQLSAIRRQCTRLGGEKRNGQQGFLGQPELLATVTAWCASHGVMAEDLRIERRTLEDVFLELTGRELRS